MRVSKPAENFAKHIHELHAEIRRKISLSKEEYKLASDVHRRSKEFNAGDYVMVHIRPERIPKTFSKKLYARAMGPYSIIRKMGSNAYLLDLPNDMDIGHVFNVEDLLPYQALLSLLLCLLVCLQVKLAKVHPLCLHYNILRRQWILSLMISS